MVRKIISRITALQPPHPPNEELVREQLTTLSRMVPLLYFVLIINSWGLAATLWGSAPRMLTLVIPVIVTLVAIMRVVTWWRRKRVPLSWPELQHALRQTEKTGTIFAVLMCGWAFLVSRYANDIEKGHIVFYVAMAMLACILCLNQLRSAMLGVATVGLIAFIGYFAYSESMPLMIMAGSFIPMIVATAVISLIQNRDFAFMVNARNTARRKHNAQSRLLRMIDDMPVAVMTVEPDTLVVNYANETSKTLIRQIEHLLPIKADSLIGTSIDVFHRHPEHQRRILGDPANLPHSARINLGDEVLDLKVSAITDSDGAYIGPMLTWALVTNEVESEQRTHRLAHFDTLTQLPNRASFNDELERRLATAGNMVGLLYIDLDGFKLINDTRGHRVGDMLLTEVAKRLHGVCTDPAMLITRLGGDEFAVLLPHANAQEAEAQANRIISALSANYDFGHGNIVIGASVGIALAPSHGDSSQILLARADIALYAAKAAGKGHALLFKPEMEFHVQERVRLEAKLRTALANREGLFIFYQPIVSIETGDVTAYEALVRWHHPLRGWISPAEFVPVAEQSGLADELGAFVLEKACREAASWESNLRVAVNISATQLGKGTLPDEVLSALVSSGLPPDRLEIEVTETALLNDQRDVIGDLRRVRALGVRVALDDFGTGYSSLSHLRAFSFDKIKIDGSFVKDAVHRPDCAAVVRAVADLGKRLGVTTVAEGVETSDQLQCLRDEGCAEVQGFLFGRPAPSAADEARIAILDQEWRSQNVA